MWDKLIAIDMYYFDKVRIFEMCFPIDPRESFDYLKTMKVEKMDLSWSYCSSQVRMALLKKS